MTRVLAPSGFALVLALTASACGGSDSKTDSARGQALTMQVGSYDLTTSREHRVVVGVSASDGTILSYGSLKFAFRGPGTKADVVSAKWTPVPGQQLPKDLPSTPQLVGSDKGIGVYAARVRFDRPGVWTVSTVVATAAGSTKIDTKFSVNDKPTQADIGQTAPATENRLPGSEPAGAVDSRAKDGPLPDPKLHTMTVKQAIATAKPTMIVISTPVYCVSRFCGPITDSVAALADRYGDTMNFVHIEVWRDRQGQNVNKASAEWIFRDTTGDLNEPFVYVVNRRGVIVERFDNVASDEELETTAQQVMRTS